MEDDDEIVGQTFVHELPIVLSGGDERRLAARFRVGADVYNSLLRECLRRLQLARESRRRKAARNSPLGGPSWARILRDFGLGEYELYRWASSKVGETWLVEHLDAQCVRALADRAVRAVIEHAYGRRGRPRLKSRYDIHSLEGKSNLQGIRFREDRIEWKGLTLRLRIDRSDDRTLHALRSPIRYVRILRRQHGTKTRYFAQLICAGLPIVEATDVPPTTIGIDPGPRVFGMVADTWAARLDLQVMSPAAKDRRLARALTRKKLARRAARIKRHSRKETQAWSQLHGYRRRAARTRACEQLRVANALVRHVGELRIERNVFRAFGRRYGRAIQQAAPARFVRSLVRKATLTGRSVVLLPTTLRLSRFCHGCGDVQRKPLTQRVHRCVCGVGPVQRDLYSAWLMKMAVLDPSGSNWRLDVDQARAAWSGARPLLQATSGPLSSVELVRWLDGIAASAALRSGSPQGIERLAGEAGARSSDARDVVSSTLRARESSTGRRRAPPERAPVAGFTGAGRGSRRSEFVQEGTHQSARARG